MKTIKFLILIGIILFAIIICLNLIFSSFQPDITIVKIVSENFNETIYIKQEVWGLSSNKLIIVSTSSDQDLELDSIKSLVFHGDSFFYKFVNDTLNLYVSKESPIPKGFNSKIKINQFELTNPYMMELWENYSEKGLKKID